MRFITLFLFGLLSIFSSCGTTQKSKSISESINQEQIQKPAEAPIRITNYPQRITVSPGKLTLVRFTESLPIHDISCDGKKVYFIKDEQNQYLFYYALSYFEKKFQRKHCQINGKGFNHRIEVTYKSFPYKREFLKVDKKRVWLSKRDQARVKREQQMLNKVYANTIPSPLFSSSFKVPLNSYITSHYGNKRIFNGKKESQHLGNDFRARIGTKIPLSNRGKVVFKGNLFYTGNTVIVYHGLDIFTVYAHLSKALVEEGQILEKGSVVGLSGNTGRVSGPHLHWGVKVSGNWVDGFSLISASKEHFQNQLQTDLQ